MRPLVGYGARQRFLYVCAVLLLSVCLFTPGHSRKVKNRKCDADTASCLHKAAVAPTSSEDSCVGVMKRLDQLVKKQYSMGSAGAPSTVPTFSLKGCDSFEPMQAMGQYPYQIAVLFKDGPFSEWPLYKKWNIDLVRKAIPETVELEAFDKSDFIYRNPTGQKMGPRFDDTPRWQKVNASGPAFVDTIMADYQKGGRADTSAGGSVPGKSDEIPRYARIVGVSNPDSVNYLKEMKEDFFDNDFSNVWDNKLHARRTGLAMNLASANLTTTSHMDTMDNYFTVSYGAKHFVMSPPSAMPFYNFYPSHHIYHRRGQFKSPPKNAPVTVSTVVPGTFLYIPHGWMHRVTATSPTIHFAMFAPLTKDPKLFDVNITNLVVNAGMVKGALIEQTGERFNRIFGVYLHQCFVNAVTMVLRSSPQVASHFETPGDYFKYHAHQVYSKRVRLELDIPPIPHVPDSQCGAPDSSIEVHETMRGAAKDLVDRALSEMERLVPQNLRFYYLLRIVDNMLPLLAEGPIPSHEETSRNLDVASGGKLHHGIGFLACLARTL